MMYNDVMGRTQIYLGDEELKLLDQASHATGASRSELIRRAVRGTYGEAGKEARLEALRRTAGAWRGRQETGAEYVEKLRRGDLNERLAELGLE